MTTNIKDFENRGYYIAYLDAKKCSTLKLFIDEMKLAFRFPAYCGNNMNAFRECINDLDWIEQKNYVLVVLNADRFLIGEQLGLRESLWQLFDEIRNEWASVPNYEGEDQYRHKADFVIIKQ